MLIFAPYQHDPNKRLLPAALVQSDCSNRKLPKTYYYTGRPPVHSPLPNTTHPLISAADGANVPEQEKNYSLKLPSIIHCSSMIHGCIIW